MSKTQLTILLLFICFLYSCDTSISHRPKSDEDYYAQEALKNNQSDTLLLGLSIGMGKEQVIEQLEKEGAWKFYSTMTGKERLHLVGLKPNEILPVDYYGENEAFFAKVVLKSENGRYSEETITILLDFYEECLLRVKVCAFGSLHFNTADCDDEMFRTLRAVLVEKYGTPYKEIYHSILWVNGSTHISLTSEGIKRFESYTSTYSYYYQPLYLITFSDWTFSKKVEEKEELKQQEEQREKKEIDSLNQERLSKEYKGL